MRLPPPPPPPRPAAAGAAAADVTATTAVPGGTLHMSSANCRRLHKRCAGRHHGELGVLKDRKNVYN